MTFPAAPASRDLRIAALDAALPQTQCTRCGYDDCRRYAVAMAEGSAATNRCPPGGDEGVRRLAVIVGSTPQAIDPSCGTEGPRRLAVIDENWCIGCALCLVACPVDAIAGAAKRMHTVIEADCTGCELCVPACPVDCISLVGVTADRTGWAAWSSAQAERARTRYEARRARLTLFDADTIGTDDDVPETRHGGGGQAAASIDAEAASRRRAAVANALARARAARNP